MKPLAVNIVVEDMAFTGGVGLDGSGKGTLVIPFKPITQDFKLFCENVVKDGLVYASGHWVSPTCVKAIWVVE